MNLTKLKNYAPIARTAIITAVTRRAAILGIQPGRVEEVTESGDVALIGGQPFPRSIVPLRKQLLDLIHRDGFDHTMEAMAYTWFNRLVALRFMELHDGYLDHGYRVLSHPQGTPLPEILQHAEHVALKGLDREEVIRLKLDGNRDEELYRLLLLAQCAELNQILPDVFSKLDDATILLLPDNLLHSDSVIRQLVAGSDAEDWQQVEVLGWLYQFYISEKKDAVMARKSAVPTEDIPAVTQLFTPHWIVRYLVENSLGRLWMDSRPNSRLIESMPYYIRPDASGDRDQGLGGREEGSYEHTKLQRPDCVAESHGLGGGDSSSQQDIPPGGTLRADQPDTSGSGVGAIEHRRGTREAIDSGVPELPLNSPGLTGGSRHPAASGPALRVSHSRASHESRPTDGGNRQNAALFASEARKVVGISEQGLGDRDELPLSSLNPNPSSLIPSPLQVNKPEEIRLVDPAVGSGHMLTYAFDLLVLIYEEEGYAPTEIPALILRHNLHGLEICPSAAQLAELALVFKAREKSRRFFQPEHLVRPRIIELRDLRFAENELRDWLAALGLPAVGSGQWPVDSHAPADHYPLTTDHFLKLLHQFEEAKNFGSLIQPCLDERAIADARRAITDHWSLATDHFPSLFLRETHLKVLRVLEQAEALTQRYHVVVANPPYMGGKAMNEALKAFGKENYENGRADLMTMFLERSFTISKKGAMLAFITLDSWMFLSSFEELRGELIRIGRVSSLIHIGWNCFPHGHLYNRGVGFVFCNAPGGGKGTFVNLSNVPATVEKEPLLLQRKNTGECVYVIDPHSFRALPGYPFAYWLSQTMRDIFKRSRPLKEVGDTRQGMATSDNNRFLRQWSEVAMQNIGFGLADREAAKKSGLKWIPYNKGGEYRKWFGNQYYVVNWADDGKELLDYAASLYGSPTRTIKSISEYFKSCISWSKVTSSDFAVRYYPTGFIFDVAGCCIFFTDPIKQTLYLGFVNSVVAKEILKSTSPTLNFETGHIAALPILSLPDDLEGAAISNINLAITNTKRDWDNFETSWDFRDQPLLRSGLKGATLEASWRNWEAQSTAAIRRMQELETENNRLFIAAYGLDGELQPEVPEAQITLARADARRDMAAFLSYAVGCMMGRFSLSAPGLILANAGDTLEDFVRIVAAKTVASDQWPVTSEKASLDAAPQLATGHCSLTTEFHPDPDGILPVLDGE